MGTVPLPWGPNVVKAPPPATIPSGTVGRGVVKQQIIGFVFTAVDQQQVVTLNGNCFSVSVLPSFPYSVVNGISQYVFPRLRIKANQPVFDVNPTQVLPYTDADAIWINPQTGTGNQGGGQLTGKQYISPDIPKNPLYTVRGLPFEKLWVWVGGVDSGVAARAVGIQIAVWYDPTQIGVSLGSNI